MSQYVAISVLCTRERAGCIVTVRMLRKATWAMLFLLLVSTQVFAATCEIRCGAMASAAMRVEMTNMAGCPGMSPASGCRQDPAFRAADHCTSHICENDTALIQNRNVSDVDSAPSFIHGYIAVQSSAAFFPASILLLRLDPDRSIHAIPTFDPLITNIRV